MIIENVLSDERIDLGLILDSFTFENENLYFGLTCMIEIYDHNGRKIATLLPTSCETTLVHVEKPAREDKFRDCNSIPTVQLVHISKEGCAGSRPVKV